MSESKPVLSIVVPFFNEEEVLSQFHARTKIVLDELMVSYEIVYVNDGSIDGSSKLVKSWIETGDKVSLIDLSRNFGKEAALVAGLDHCAGEFIVVIDADLQDPPELIATLYQQISASDFDVIYGKRTFRKGETLLKKISAYFFYRLVSRISETKIPKDTGDFRIMNRRAVNAFRQLRERTRFSKGLFSWIGYKQAELTYQRDARYAGDSKWQYGKLMGLAVQGITSFSFFPLKLATYSGFFIAFFSFLYACYIIIDTLLFGNPVAGYPSTMVVILFMGGVQLLAIGILGSYLGRVFEETKQRPLYFINEIIKPEDSSQKDKNR